jgi:hypothetical protein
MVLYKKLNRMSLRTLLENIDFAFPRKRRRRFYQRNSVQVQPVMAKQTNTSQNYYEQEQE